MGRGGAVSAIEAVGTVVEDPSGSIPEGTTVTTIMGGLGMTPDLVGASRRGQ